jgi:serine/threonine protein kinase
MEYMDLGTLGDILKRCHQIPEVMLGLIAFQVLNGLDYLHRSIKLIHRDIKPSNLLVNSNGSVKISDFGVSGQLMNSKDQRSTWIGTVTYMSPERFRGGCDITYLESYSWDTDLWSLGLTLLECAWGRYPYPSPEENGIAQK